MIPDNVKRAVRLAGMRPMPRWPARSPIDLRGKRILLTGASSGIGAVAAGKLAAEGATMIVVARREDVLDDLVREITDTGGDALAIRADLADLDQVDALVDQVGSVDILINNAARSIRRPLIESLERWHDVERVTALNYFAPLRLIRGFAPGMLERGDGHIINVATWRVLPESSPMFAAYNASKAALSAVSRVIDTEWGRSGVHSTTVYYPLVATPMIAPTRAYDGLVALTSDEAADWMVTAAKTRPIRIAPRKALALRALDVVAPRMLNSILERETNRLNARMPQSTQSESRRP
ncbi:SDR family oxidoreductase [Mycolicibacterium confluentis]|uniref:Oxidoreductase n=1 Tax=Mycolicibacterium confluentis TaxID=28047 RepID=A0A7I7Y127_9MYCO|nr:SDR family oxidoreductase [Mycolicibacterium confluentis]ORV34776.1 short-chain dehydrogenase [Mycolicibacterium confluentis]BBZ35297.1 oxidoreductase [Mycolicibacterium confluentis]